jgi:thiamine transport system ATP-binding protein
MLRLEELRIEMQGFSLAADLAVPAGARVAVIGPSGAGKSTLLAAIAGFQPLSRGRVTWQGQDLGPLAPGRRPLSILFQDNNLFPHLTAAENIGLALRPSLRLRCRAGSRAGWRWRGRFCGRGRYCCSTSPSRHWDRRCGRRCWIW